MRSFQLPSSSRRRAIIDQILQNGPQAVAETKALALQSAWSNLGEAAASRLIESHADKRRSAEAAEGLASFAEKRPARWSLGRKKRSPIGPRRGRA